MENTLLNLCLVLGLISALVAGVFQSFSDFVMAGLARAAPAGGMESMQHINRTVFRSVFLTSFLALVPVTVVFSLLVAMRADGTGRWLVMGSTAIYVVSVFLVTVARNVPMNKKLDQMDHTDPDAARYWQTYVRSWTRWNHVRTAGSVVTAGGFLLAAAAFGGAA